MLLQESIFN